MATAVLGKSIETTSNATTYSFASHTPAGADRLMVVLARVIGTVTTPTMSDSGQGLTWTRVRNDADGSNMLSMFWAVTTSATAFTATISHGGDAGTGCSAVMYEVTGANNSTPITQQNLGTTAAAGTPAVTLAGAFASANLGLGFLGNASNPAGVTPPASWTEDHDSGFASPTTGGESASRNSGETLQTITWGSTTATASKQYVVEVAAAAAAATSLIVPRATAQEALLLR